MDFAVREYRLVFGTSESCDVFLRKSDDEKDLLRSMHELALLGGEVGQRFEIRNHEGTVLHRIDVQLVYTVRPGVMKGGVENV